jgi:hypothetical protein
MTPETLTQVDTEVQVNLDNDELIVIEPLQYGAYEAASFAPGCGGCSNCNCNSNSNGSSEEPLG